jgi:hypothetical protein
VLIASWSANGNESDLNPKHHYHFYYDSVDGRMAQERGEQDVEIHSATKEMAWRQIQRKIETWP